MRLPCFCGTPERSPTYQHSNCAAELQQGTVNGLATGQHAGKAQHAQRSKRGSTSTKEPTGTSQAGNPPYTSPRATGSSPASPEVAHRLNKLQNTINNVESVLQGAASRERMGSGSTGTSPVRTGKGGPAATAAAAQQTPTTTPRPHKVSGSPLPIQPNSASDSDVGPSPMLRKQDSISELSNPGEFEHYGPDDVDIEQLERDRFAASRMGSGSILSRAASSAGAALPFRSSSSIGRGVPGADVDARLSQQRYSHQHSQSGLVSTDANGVGNQYSAVAGDRGSHYSTTGSGKPRFSASGMMAAAAAGVGQRMSEAGEAERLSIQQVNPVFGARSTCSSGQPSESGAAQPTPVTPSLDATALIYANLQNAQSDTLKANHPLPEQHVGNGHPPAQPGDSVGVGERGSGASVKLPARSANGPQHPGLPSVVGPATDDVRPLSRHHTRELEASADRGMQLKVPAAEAPAGPGAVSAMVKDMEVPAVAVAGGVASGVLSDPELPETPPSMAAGKAPAPTSLDLTPVVQELTAPSVSPRAANSRKPTAAQQPSASKPAWGGSTHGTPAARAHGSGREHSPGPSNAAASTSRKSDARARSPGPGLAASMNARTVSPGPGGTQGTGRRSEMRAHSPAPNDYVRSNSMGASKGTPAATPPARPLSGIMPRAAATAGAASLRPSSSSRVGTGQDQHITPVTASTVWSNSLRGGGGPSFNPSTRASYTTDATKSKVAKAATPHGSAAHAPAAGQPVKEGGLGSTHAAGKVGSSQGGMPTPSSVRTTPAAGASSQQRTPRSPSAASGARTPTAVATGKPAGVGATFGRSSTPPTTPTGRQAAAAKPASRAAAATASTASRTAPSSNDSAAALSKKDSVNSTARTLSTGTAPAVGMPDAEPAAGPTLLVRTYTGSGRQSVAESDGAQSGQAVTPKSLPAGHAATAPAAPGQDVCTDSSLTPCELPFGQWRLVRLHKAVPCDACAGTALQETVDGSSEVFQCDVTLASGALAAVIYHGDTITRQPRTWVFCADPLCLGSCPTSSSLPSWPKKIQLGWGVKITRSEYGALKELGLDVAAPQQPQQQPPAATV